MNSAEDRAVTNYFCTVLPAAFQNAVGRTVWKELQQHSCCGEHGTTRKGSGNYTGQVIEILSVLIRVDMHNNV